MARLRKYGILHNQRLVQTLKYMLALATRLILIVGGIALLIALLPTSPGLPVDVTNALTYVISFARSFDWLFPINTLFTVLKLSILFWTAVLLFKMFRWLLHLLTTSSAGSS